MELDPRNRRALELLLLAAPAFQFGPVLQAVLDAARLLDMEPSRQEILRIFKAWTLINAQNR